MPRPKTEAAEYKKLMLRLPASILDACSSIALRDHRSMNSQILYVLEEWLLKEKRYDSRRSIHA